MSERLGRHLLMAGEPLPATAAMLRAAEERLAQRQLAQVERILDARAETLRRLDTPEEDPLWGEGPVVRCRMLRLRGKTQQAEEIGEEALRLARQYGWNQVRVKALAELSELARARGDLREAWRATTEAEPVARTINDPDLLARVRRKRGRLALLRGDLELAEELLLKAREVFMRNGDMVRAASCLRALGGVAAQQGLLEEAARRATQSLDASEGAGDRPGAAAAQCLLADIARRSDELEQARDDYSDAESRFERAGMTNVLSVTVGRALLRRAVGGARRAEPALRSALAEAEHIGQRPTQGVLHVMLLESAAGRGDRGAWEDHMAAARVLLVESGRIDHDMAEIAEAAGHAARKNGWEDAARSAFGLAMVQYTKLLRADDVVRCKAAMRG